MLVSQEEHPRTLALHQPWRVQTAVTKQFHSRETQRKLPVVWRVAGDTLGLERLTLGRLFESIFARISCICPVTKSYPSSLRVSAYSPFLCPGLLPESTNPQAWGHTQ